MMNQIMSTVNSGVTVSPSIPTATTQVKDTRWLTLEVCREFQRSKCSRSDTDCKYAHPPPHVEIQNGRVTACFDSIKGKCQRKEPPCKYLHPPQHLKEVLLQNGRRNLILKNSMLSSTIPYLSMPTYMPGYAPIMYDLGGKTLAYPGSMVQAQNPYMTNPYYTIPSPQMIPWQHMNGMNGMYSSVPIPLQPPTDIDNSAAVIAQQIPAICPPQTTLTSSPTPKATRPDRLEVCREYRRGICTRPACECRYAHPPDTVAVDYNDNHVTNCIPGMIPITKRIAVADKSGIPMYQPAMTMSAYQQALAMQLGQPQYIPTVSATNPYITHPTTLTRY